MWRSQKRAERRGAASCPANFSSLLPGGQTAATRAAYRAFFLTSAYFNFWGSNDHVAKFIEAVHDVAGRIHVQGSLIDVGAAPYNVIGGDVSHLLVYLKHWGCSADHGMVIGFEPMEQDYMRLIKAVRQQITSPLRVVRAGRTEFHILDAAGRPCASLRNHPVSDVPANVTIAPQANAGANTASLNPHYQARGWFAPRVRAVTLDEELGRLGQAARDVLLLKVDVEGHEVAVLDGAREAMAAGRVHAILLEYGDKMSPQIWDGMKAKFEAFPAGDSPRDFKGLHWLRGYADARGCAAATRAAARARPPCGRPARLATSLAPHLLSTPSSPPLLGRYDVFLLGAARGRPVLVGVSGELWSDAYEVRPRRAACALDERPLPPLASPGLA